MTEKTADRAMLLDEAKSLHWDYSIDLGDGVVTQGINSPDALRDQSGVVFSEPVAGKSVLYIGCWDGYLSTEAARHGAKSVLATDDFVWRAGQQTAQRRAFCGIGCPFCDPNQTNRRDGHLTRDGWRP